MWKLLEGNVGVLGGSWPPWVCQQPVGGIEMLLCVSETSKKFGAWSPNRSWDIDLTFSHVFAQNSAQFLVLVLCPQVCQQLPSGLKMFLCVSESSKNFDAWGPNRSWDIDLPTLPCICSTWPSFGALVLHLQVWQHLPSSLEMLLCVSGASINIWHMRS